MRMEIRNLSRSGHRFWDKTPLNVDDPQFTSLPVFKETFVLGWKYLSNVFCSFNSFWRETDPVACSVNVIIQLNVNHQKKTLETAPFHIDYVEGVSRISKLVRRLFVFFPTGCVVLVLWEYSSQRRNCSLTRELMPDFSWMLTNCAIRYSTYRQAVQLIQPVDFILVFFFQNLKCHFKLMILALFADFSQSVVKLF